MRTFWIYIYRLLWIMWGMSLLSCSESLKDELNTPEAGNGKSYLTLRLNHLTMNVSGQIDNTVAETKLSTIDIYIYQSDNTLERLISLTQDDFMDEDEHIWQLKEECAIELTAGEKQIYAGVNLPEKYRNVFEFTSDNPAQGIEDFEELYNNEIGHPMFSRKVVTCQLKENEVESITLPVERLLSKIAVFDNISIYSLGKEGVFSSLQYDVYNNNSRFYLLRNTDEYIDPNYTQSGWKNNEYKDDLTPGTGFIPIEKDPLLYTSYHNVKYCLENTTEVYDNNNYSKLLNTATYVWLSAVFTPTTVTIPSGNRWLSGQENTYPAGTTFYRLTYPDNSREYLVGTDRDKAKKYAVEKAKANHTYPVILDTFSEGMCYYISFIDPAGNYNICRNHFYRLYLNGFAGLGSPGEVGEEIVDSGTDPNPGPVPNPNPDPSLLLIEVTFTDWYPYPEEWEW